MKSIALKFLLATLILLPAVSCSKKTPTEDLAKKKEATASDSKPEKSTEADSGQTESLNQESASPDSKTAAPADRTQEPDLTQLSAEELEKLAAAQLETINKEYGAAVTRLNVEIEKLDSDREKQALYDKKNPEPEYTRQLFAMAQKFPQTDAAFTAGMTIILEFPNRAEFPQTMDLILEHHAQRVPWPSLVGGYLELVPSKQIEGWLRKMIDRAGNDEIKVQMTFFLYQYFDQFPTFAATIEYNPQYKKRYSQERIDYIYNRNQEVRQDLLTRLKELKESFPDVKADGNRVVKNVIDGPIFELENLQVGSTAPDIEGKDFDGVEFRLSDYRGKVVMLDFWGQWCPPCRAMFPHERELIEKLAGKPFVLIGVNSDRRLETAIKATREENLVWRNFWCGPQGRAGPIAKKWNVSAWPTVYLIDANGVIRYKEVLGRDIDLGIQTLLTEMGHPTNLVDANPDQSSPYIKQKPFGNPDRLLAGQK